MKRLQIPPDAQLNGHLIFISCMLFHRHKGDNSNKDKLWNQDFPAWIPAQSMVG